MPLVTYWFYAYWSKTGSYWHCLIPAYLLLIWLAYGAGCAILKTAKPPSVRAHRRLLTIRTRELFKMAETKSTPKICDVEGCARPVNAKDLCKTSILGPSPGGKP
jgi:hypothetical protein